MESELENIPEGLVTVMRCPDPVAAELIRAKLESSGVETHLADILTVSTDWGLTGAVGGIRVQVRESEAAAAREIIQSVPASAEEPASAINQAGNNVREKRAEQAARYALVGCLFPPLQILAFVSICRVLFGRGDMSPIIRRQFWFGVLVNFFVLIAGAIVLAVIFHSEA